MNNMEPENKSKELQDKFNLSKEEADRVVRQINQMAGVPEKKCPNGKKELHCCPQECWVPEKKDVWGVWDEIAPLVDEMRAKYPKELNIDGFEPALTTDICEIVLKARANFIPRAEVVEKVEKLRITAMSGIGLDEDEKGYNAALNDLLDLLTQEK